MSDLRLCLVDPRIVWCFWRECLMRRLLACLIAVGALAVAACAPPRAAAPVAPAPTVTLAPAQVASVQKPKVSAFQETLDKHGVPLRVHRWGKSILVNIPSYELIALENGEEKFRMRVIVGAPGEDRATPVIDTFTSVARFRPTWTPTPTMIRPSTKKTSDNWLPPNRATAPPPAAIR